MEGLEVRNVTVANLPDLVTPCMIGGTLGSHLSLSSEQAGEMTRDKLAFFHERMRKGASAMAAYRGHRIVAVLEYYPVELAPFPIVGNDLFVINCLQVPEREGRELVEKELVAACVKDWSTRKGVVVLGREKAWDALGFEEVLKAEWPEGDDLTLWLMKFWEVEEPRLVPVKWDFSVPKGRVKIDVFESGYCPWGRYVFDLVRKVAEEFGSAAVVDTWNCESREKVLECGVRAGVALNGEFRKWLRPHPLPTADTVRRAIEDLL